MKSIEVTVLPKENPVRIQRSRQVKQISPNGLPVVYVGRPSKWSNPYPVGGRLNLTAQEAVNIFKQYITKWYSDEEIKEDLKGKNLSCWCKIGEPCHADILLKIANET